VEIPGNYYVEIYDREGFMATIKYSVELPVPTTSDTTTLTATPTVPRGLPFPLAGLATGLMVAAALGLRKRSR